MIVMSFAIIIYLYLVTSIVTSSINPRIIGGENANIEEFPYLVSLRRKSDNQHICGGAIISDRCILTAAHCFHQQYLTLRNLKIFSGTTYLINEPRSTHLAEQIIIHPKFIGMTEETRYSYDIAVVVVEGVIKLNDFQNIVKLPSKNIRHGDIGMLAGWGYTIYPSSTSSNRLQKVEMNVYDTYQCRVLVPFNLKIDQFCGYKRMGIGACIGDSGGPLVVDNVVIGISSLTIPCAQGVPDVYTNVKYHTDFITAALQT